MRDHAHTLSDFLVPTLSIECEACGRRGRYDVRRLIAVLGAYAKLEPKWVDKLSALRLCRRGCSIRSC
jgi:hypothetical protein